MKYQRYIDLGFIRTDMQDNVEFRQIGYHGFCLEIELGPKMAIAVCSGELDQPKLYIRKNGSESSNHIIPISFDCVVDLCSYHCG